MRKIKRDDPVKIITGKDKGKTGKTVTVNIEADTVLVRDCSMITKHTKPSTGSPNGGIVNQEGSIDISSVMLVVNGKVTKVGSEVRDDKRVRIAETTGKAID